MQLLWKVGVNRAIWALLLLLLIGCLSGLAWLLDRLYPLQLPAPEQQATLVLAQGGEPLRAFTDPEQQWRYPIELSQVSPLYLKALLHYEDRWFYYHPGVNPLALLRASWQNATEGRVISGGSTLSMQVARLLHPHRRTIAGKLYQMVRTLQLEWHFSKAEILQLYLNIAPFGGNISGVQAASLRYLAKPATELTHSEAALLAVLPQLPSRYRPDKYPLRATQARDKVLRRLLRDDIWPSEVVADALTEPVLEYRAQNPLLAPLLARRLKQQHQLDASQKTAQLIHTTIDSHWQRALQSYVKHYVAQLPAGASAALLLVDNKTAAVKVYIGSADFSNNQRFAHVDMVQGLRSPGSTLKPFLFGYAIERGLIHSDSLLADVPITWSDYRPTNFSGGFRGPVTASDALRLSLNVPFVSLLEQLGPQRFAAQLHQAGLPLTLASGKADLSLILGGAAVSLQQLVQGYSALARQGQVMQLKWLEKELVQPIEQRYLLSDASAWVSYQALAERLRPDALLNASSLAQQAPIAWKTGTSYGYRDSWAIGSSSEYTLGVWLGRPDNLPMPGHYGQQTAAPLLFAAFDYLASQGVALTAPAQPAAVSQADICWPLGQQLASQPAEFCQQSHRAWLVDQTAPVSFDPAQSAGWQTNPLNYYVSQDKGLRVNVDCQGVIAQLRTVPLWPAVLEPWLVPAQRRSQLIAAADPRCRAPVITPAELTIAGVQQGQDYWLAQEPRDFTIRVRALAGVGELNWYLNGRWLQQSASDSWLEIELAELGQQQLLAIDSTGNLALVEFELHQR